MPQLATGPQNAFNLPLTEKIWADKRSKGLIKKLMRDGLVCDGTFAVVSAHFVGGFTGERFKYSEELQYELLHAQDDLTFNLRLFYLFAGRGKEWFVKFAEKYNLDPGRFYQCLDVTKEICVQQSPKNAGQSYFDTPNTIESRIKYVADVFAEFLSENTALYTGTELVNFKHNIKLKVVKSSIAWHKFSSSGQYNPSVYFASEPAASVATDDGVDGQMIHFVSTIPLYLHSSLPFTQMFLYTEDFSAGKLLAAKLKYNPEIIKNEFGPYVSFKDYVPASGTIAVICSPVARDTVQLFIKQQMLDLQRSAEVIDSERRHFFHPTRQAMVILSAGVKVLNVILDGSKDSVAFLARDPAQKFVFFDDVASKKRLLELCKPHGDIVSSYVYTDTNGQILVHSFASPQVADNVIKNLPRMEDISKKLHNFDSDDFFGRTKSGKSVEPEQPVELGRGKCYECQVCRCVPPSDRPYVRLSICGHLTCDECLLKNLTDSTSFPILCAGCPGIVLLTDIDEVLGRTCPDREDLHKLLLPVVEKSIENFLQTNKMGYHQCKSDGCQGILQSDDDTNAGGEKILCQHCQTDRCSVCAYAFHGDETCQSFYERNFVLHNESVSKWKSEQPETRRFCPNVHCNVLIEKPEGCNHMQCRECKTHFCWTCQYQADSSRDVYAHLQSVHGSIGNGYAYYF